MCTISCHLDNASSPAPIRCSPPRTGPSSVFSSGNASKSRKPAMQRSLPRSISIIVASDTGKISSAFVLSRTSSTVISTFGESLKMETLPIAPPSKETREAAEPAVTRLIEITKAENDTRSAVLDSLRMQFAVTDPGNKLSDFPSLDSDTFVQEVLKRRPKAAGKLKAADMKALREMFGDEALPIHARRREALVLERRLSTLVNEAYGLTAEEVALLWTTAPPRMPFKPE